MQLKKFTQKDRYGNTTSYEFEGSEKPLDPTKLMEKQMEMMNQMVPPMSAPPVMGEEFQMGDPNNHPGEPMGEDTVPAWLTPGEFVVNAEATEMFGPEIEAMNEAGRMMQRGGRVAPAQFTAAPLLYQNEGGGVPMPIPYEQALLESREGYVPEIYLDSLGKPTIGHGHLIEDAVWDASDPRIGTQPYTEDELNSFFADDRETAQSAARRNVGDDIFDGLNRKQQAALTSMAFQLGEKGQSKFKKMIAAIKEGNNREVARQALTGSKGGKSKWLKQTPVRALDLAEAFDPDMAAQYRNAGGMVYDDMPAQYAFWGKKIEPGVVQYSPQQQMLNDFIDAGYSPEDAVAAVKQAMGTAGLPADDMEVPPQPEVPVLEDPAIQQQIAMADNMVAGGDGDDLGTAPTAVPGMDAPMPTPHDSIDMTDPNAAWAENLAGTDWSVSDEWKQGGPDVEPPAPMEDPYAEPTVTPMDPAAKEEMRKRFEGRGRHNPQTEWKVKETNKRRWEEALAKSGQSKRHYDSYGPSEETIAAHDEIIAASGQTTPPVVSPPTEPPGTEPKVDTFTPEGEAEINELLKQASDAENEEVQGEAQSLFSKMGLDSLFDPKELTRMAVLYGASRLLGYDHTGSLRWAAKQHLQRVDAKDAGFQQLALSGKYTPESLKAFKKSGDYSVLQAKGSPRVLTGEFKTMYGPNGQEHRVQKVKIGDQVTWQTGDGRMVDTSWSDDPSTIPGTKAYGDRIKTDSKQYTSMIEDLRKGFGTIPGGRDQADTFKTDLAPSVAGNKIAKWAADNNVPAQNMGTIIENAYHSAVQHSEATGEKVRDITPFLEEQYVIAQVGDSTLFEGISGTNVSKLLGGAQSAYEQKHGTRPSTTAVMQAYRKAWNALSQEEQESWNDKATTGENGFMKFVQNDITTSLSE